MTGLKASSAMQTLQCRPCRKKSFKYQTRTMTSLVAYRHVCIHTCQSQELEIAQNYTVSVHPRLLLADNKHFWEPCIGQDVIIVSLPFEGMSWSSIYRSPCLKSVSSGGTLYYGLPNHNLGNPHYVLHASCQAGKRFQTITLQVTVVAGIVQNTSNVLPRLVSVVAASQT